MRKVPAYTIMTAIGKIFFKQTQAFADLNRPRCFGSAGSDVDRFQGMYSSGVRLPAGM
jgi:hypothetical protein